MKPTKLLFVVLSCYFLCSCFKKKEYLQNVTVDNKGLSCDGIEMSNYAGTLTETTFNYGEKVTFTYDNFKGLTFEDNRAYPKMDIHVMSKSGDTVFSIPEFFDKEGITKEELSLFSEVTFARPMLPENDYLVSVNISDTKNDNYYHWKKSFKIINNPELKTKADGFTYDIQYLYSLPRDIAITNNVIKTNEKVYLILENLEGYNVDEDGNASIIASMNLVDANDRLIVENDNLLPNSVSAKDLKQQLYVLIEITDKDIPNPVTCNFQLKDALSGKTLSSTFELTVEEQK
ncbi:Wzt-like putative exopolysaccharide export protein [Kordia periserrulae]|uniref:Wzt-like putative exopolysaccharide export protein n=1 Tax=Kordia periserrulae TaxID=701523 RepID=A0A2T6BSC0_9FLAO|nr:Wzt carbohydrate-binding domain-containing protein [Kordia periserrulae]PTX58939.1 Wzt-like putative exopolysaccharide export protein [Kordia periserrulae]